jgi:DNA polymerase I
VKPSTPDAYRLMMEGTQALTDVEANGMRVDVSYLNRMIEETGDKIKSVERELMEDEIYETWQKTYGDKANLGSRQQLGKILFDVLKIKPDANSLTTTTKRPKVDIEALERINIPFIKKLVSVEKLKKLRSTYLVGILREVDDDGFVHPFFNLHLVVTQRSSSSNPNFQNIPKREEGIAKIIRKAFICRSDDYVMVEIDYGALEFRGCGSFWQDPSMIEYASNPELDIHRDMAAECYLLDTDNVSKLARTFAKNQFVFPILYGSYYVKCAKALWDMIGRADIKTQEGVSLYKHLEDHGVFNQEDFERHIRSVEDSFNRRFSHWSKQKEVWWNDYVKRGWFPMSTGFICSGIYSRNFLMNAPIQGPSFHCLLWSLIQINKWLKKNNMKSMVVGQIHDSIKIDAHKSELDDVLATSKRIMTKDIRKHWDWILTPLTIETELSETDWYSMKAIEE